MRCSRIIILPNLLLRHHHLKYCIGVICAIVIYIAVVPSVIAVDRSDPSGCYSEGPCLMTAGTRAVLFYSAEHLNESDSGCGCFFDFKKTGDDDTWRMAGDSNFGSVTMIANSNSLTLNQKIYAVGVAV